jgi:hypothetical protein
METTMGIATDQEIRAVFEDGPLGVLVTHAESRPLLEDLLIEANKLGIEVAVFFTDAGVQLLADHGWVDRLPEGHFSACDLSARARGVEAAERVNVAGQFHNAMMVCDAARVVSL